MSSSFPVRIARGDDRPAAGDTLAQAARWMRSFHRAVTDFVPPSDAVWRMGGQWAPG